MILHGMFAEEIINPVNLQKTRTLIFDTFGYKRAIKAISTVRQLHGPGRYNLA